MSILNYLFEKIGLCADMSLPGFLQARCSLLNKNSLKMTAKSLVIMSSVFGFSACNAGPEMVSTSVTGYNHTSSEIIRFSINGAGGPRIPPNSGGGAEVCCSTLPLKWSPSLSADIEWDKDPNPRGPIERDQYGQIKKEAAIRHATGYSHHTATVDIPKYVDEFCALQVHFLPCDQVKVSTTCFTPENPNYPDKAYFKAKESATCSNH
ncbi:Protein of unknown function [Pseudomonas helmanticensis]|uniref:Uncharacterized protein n=1 Tax=Pseudomonas helmanticensis TaxID=1471381 RepID=A0ACD2U9W0_9PSED|nr:DUF3304 domain-containing protein [Pseudomonas helmanticensis]SMQ28301.1 Protein of unknown function [Pseudomonas helmanticensis]